MPFPGNDSDVASVERRLEHVLLMRAVVNVSLEDLKREDRIIQPFGVRNQLKDSAEGDRRVEACFIKTSGVLFFQMLFFSLNKEIMEKRRSKHANEPLDSWNDLKAKFFTKDSPTQA